MAASLTQNAILALNNGDVDLDPVVQILDVRQVATGEGAQERYRVVLSDGLYVQPAFLVTQLNEFAKSGQVQRGSIVKLIKYICDSVQNRKIIMVLSMEVVVYEAEIIGDPHEVIMDAYHLQKLQQTPAMQAQGPAMQAPSADLEVFQGSGHGFGVNARASGGARTHVLDKSPSTHAHARSPSTHARAVTASPSQPAHLYSNPRPILKNAAPAPIVPIAALNQFRGRWTIKARVTAKEELQRYKNAKGEGRFFHFGLLDAEGDVIRVTCFNDVADQFHDRIEVGKVYMLSKGLLKPAQRPYNHLKGDWEIHMESTSMLELCCEGDGSIPLQIFDFTTIREIEHMEANSMVDLLGVVLTVEPTTRIMRKYGTETQRRSLQLLDMSGRTVEVTMWGTFCNNQGQQLQDLLDSGQFPVLALKAGRISDFDGKSVVTIRLSQLVVNPNLPQAFEVKKWFEQVGRNTALQSISKAGGGGGMDKVKDEGLGPLYNGYGGLIPARITPVGPLGVKDLVAGCRVRTKSTQARMTDFFGVLKKGCQKRSQLSTTMDRWGESRPLVTNNIREGMLPIVKEERATQRSQLLDDRSQHCHQR